MTRHWIRRPAAVAVLLIFSTAPATLGYSVLTHEAIIDATWDSDIKPLLLKRFPNTLKDQMREAHAHAYGGAIIQDMGYYPGEPPASKPFPGSMVILHHFEE